MGLLAGYWLVIFSHASDVTGITYRCDAHKLTPRAPMAVGTLSPHIRLGEPKPTTGGGGRPPLNNSHGGDGWGGGGRSGDDAPDYSERLKRYRLGIAVALVSIVTLFVCFGAAYIMRETASVYDINTGKVARDWQPLDLPLALLWLNTVILVVSSITLELARRQAIRRSILAPAWSIPGVKSDDRSIPWLPITVALGFAFLTGQCLAWLKLEQRGWLVSTNVSSSFFYILTATHALHLLGGIVALLYALFLTLRRKPYEQRRIVIDVTAWYWHVIGVLWICLFFLIAYSGHLV